MLNRAAPLVTLENAGIYRAGRWLVRGVSMTVGPGEIVTLIGPNGSGKSTTARMSLDILKPDEGSASLRAGLRLAYVPQKLTIDWTLPLSVRRLMRLTGKASDKEIDHAMDQTGVSHLADAQVRTLSGGEFQRALLARHCSQAGFIHRCVGERHNQDPRIHQKSYIGRRLSRYLGRLSHQ